MPKFKINGWLIAGAILLCYSLGEFGVFNPLIAKYEANKEAGLMKHPGYARNKHLAQVQADMERQASQLPIGKQLDLMIQARKSGKDLSRTAADNWGGEENAPLANYVYQDWAFRQNMGIGRLDLLLTKIERDGLPSIGKLKRYQATASNCSAQEAAGPGYDHGKEACIDFASMMDNAGHGRGSEMFAAGKSYEVSTSLN